jgi:hypothetical protein
MTIEQLREKIAYRTNKMNWCISVGRETQAEWNRDQIARLEESIRVMEQDAAMEDCVVHPVSIWQLRTEIALANVNRGRGNVQHHYVPPNDIQPNVRNRPARNTDEDFDYV